MLYGGSSKLYESKKYSNTDSENGDLSKTMTDINVIKTTIYKMLNEIDSEDQSMNMGELGSKLVKRYPDFDVRNYGDKNYQSFLVSLNF